MEERPKKQFLDLKSPRNIEDRSAGRWFKVTTLVSLEPRWLPVIGPSPHLFCLP